MTKTLFSSFRIALVLAISSTSVAPSLAVSVATDKTTYRYNEPITISWDYGSTALDINDYVGLTLATVTSLSDVYSDLIFYVFTQTETQEYPSSATRTNGTVTFDAGAPDESWNGRPWPLSPGEYKVHFANNVVYGGNILASSLTFTVVPVPKTITTDKSVYLYDEPIEISWDYGSTALDVNDYVGLTLATVTSLSDVYADLIFYVFTQTESQEYPSSATRTNGTVTFDAGAPDESWNGRSWPLLPGEYKVHLANSVLYGGNIPVSSLAFTVAPPTTSSPTSAPSVAPTPYPSSYPSATPLPYPSSYPSAAPSLYPSSTPSTAPLSRPSSKPSANPVNTPAPIANAPPMPQIVDASNCGLFGFNFFCPRHGQCGFWKRLFHFGGC